MVHGSFSILLFTLLLLRYMLHFISLESSPPLNPLLLSTFCVHMHVCVRVCLCVFADSLTCALTFVAFPFDFGDVILNTEPGTLSRVINQCLPWSLKSLYVLQHWGCRCLIPHPAFYMSADNPNSGPQAYSRITSTTVTSP